MPYRNRSITIEDGAWIGAQVFVSPGVTIGTEAVITAGSTVQRDQPAKMVCTVAPVSSIKPRWPENDGASLQAKAPKPCSIDSNIKPNTKTASLSQASSYRQILGVSFFVGEAIRAVEIGSQGGLIVVPAAPALLQLESDVEYRRALQNADLAITDSGFMVVLWRLMTGERIRRVSGLEYLRLLLSRSDLKQPDAVLWVMPSPASTRRNLQWLQAEGFPFKVHNCYVAPKYSPDKVVDDCLVSLVDRLRPRHIIIALGGGVQEKLGLYLRQRCQSTPAIHCIGAALGFLTGDQVRIPRWADQWILGWLFRCISNPARFVPRYANALRLSLVLWRYRSEMPNLTVVNGSN
jgi:exopolysaccharide biosynthesis WecB/TagA/CpsF family protein